MPYKDIDRQHEAQKRYRQVRVDMLVALKSRPCVDCVQTFPHYIMEFDHVPSRGPKRFNISEGTMRSRRRDTLEDELAKCDLVCANCHKTRTYLRRQHLL